MHTHKCLVCGEIKEFKSYKVTTCDDCTDAGLRYCTGCGEVLPVDEFYFNTTRQQYMSVCKQCHTGNTSAHQCEKREVDNDYRLARNKHRVDYHNKKKAESGWLDERNRKAREWRAERIAYDPDYLLQCNAYSQKYRANLRGSYTVDEWIACLEAYDYKCAYCGTEYELTIDHIVAVSQGGYNYAFNLVPACKHCNSSKAAHEIVEWYSAQPFYDENKLRSIHKRYRALQDKLISESKGGDATCQR